MATTWSRSIPTLQNLRGLVGPQFLHVVTRKGHGYVHAEVDPILYHGPGRFDPAVGIRATASPQPTYTQVFGDWLCDMAAADGRLVAITPAMREGSGMVRFEREYPQRYFDVGIAEQHAVTFAAGLACEGIKPVVAIYSTFLQRAYDQLIHDVALQNLPVVFALDRGGLVGADGATHHGAFDLSYLRCIPNLVVMAPSDENLCRKMLSTAFVHDGPAAVRYPRGTGVGAPIEAGLGTVAIGRGQVLRESSARPGSRIAILGFGPLVHPALVAAQAIDASVVDMRFVKPLDLELLRQMAQTHDAVGQRRRKCPAGRGRQRLRRGSGRVADCSCRCYAWDCPTDSSTTAITRAFWPPRDWTPRASRRPSAHALLSCCANQG